MKNAFRDELHDFILYALIIIMYRVFKRSLNLKNKLQKYNKDLLLRARVFC